MSVTPLAQKSALAPSFTIEQVFFLRGEVRGGGGGGTPDPLRQSILGLRRSRFCHPSLLGSRHEPKSMRWSGNLLVHVYKYLYVYNIHIYIYICICICVYVCIYVSVYLGVCRDAPPQTVTVMGICICVYIYTNGKINIYIYIWRDSRVDAVLVQRGCRMCVHVRPC